MLDFYKKLHALLDARERRRAALVLVLLLAVAFVEALGIASILPFIAVLANPQIVHDNRFLAMAYEQLGFSSIQGFIVFLGLFFLAVIIFSLLLRALGTWALLQFAQTRNHEWGTRLIGGYLRQPYEWFLDQHTSDFATAVLAEVREVVNGSLVASMQIISHTLVLIFLLSLLIVVDFTLTLVLITILGGGYAIVVYASKGPIRSFGAQRRSANMTRFNIIQEAFAAVKEIKVSGLEELYVSRFRVPAKRMARMEVLMGLLTQIPSLAIQAIMFGGMLLVLLYLMATYGNFQDAVPVATLFALAASRLLPSFKRIYEYLSRMRASEASLNALSKDFSTLQTSTRASPDMERPDHSPRRLKNRLALKNVSYTYPNSSHPALEKINLEIPAFSTVGVVGTTGSGKTTTIDLILGLLRPSHGTIEIDGEELTDDQVRSWQRSLGYVPQQVFLADDSLARNIALGLPTNDIDMGAVQRAATVANLHEFVTRELPDGYLTEVGERGVRLSGGQRQRIGIARALYHNPDILVLDEATSALDNLTEQAVMDAVRNLGNKKTIIIIAHRLTTVEPCDRIFVLEQGKVLSHGTYHDLISTNSHFKAMATMR